jgi:uncharacterized protein involved in outer membrane biogenesis
MTAKRRRILIIAGGLIALIAIAAIVAGFLFDINAYKPKIETAASEATGLHVGINGKMRLAFFPFGLSAQDVHVVGKGGEVLSLDHIKLGAEFMPLLKGRLTVTDCELVNPTITIVRDAAGTYNFGSVEKKPPGGLLGTTFSLNEIKLSKGTLVYLDKKTGEKTELKELNLAIRNFSVADGPGDVMQKVSFAGSVDCRELQKGDLRIDNIRSPVTAQKGVIVFTPLTMDFFGAKGEGDATVDMAKADTEYQINVKVPKLDCEKLTTSFGLEKMIGGKGDLAVSLAMKEKEGRVHLNGLDGTMSLRASNLITYTADLDKVLAAYEKSQKFNLVDIGAFFIVGPLGSVALKAYRYGDVYYQAQGGQGAITQFASDWKIRNGEAEAVDCALATRHNRVALKGKLNLASERYENVTVALLNEKGCALFTQSISGSFGSPRIGVVSTIGSLAAPIMHLYRQVKRFLQGGKCEAFYNGSVEQPRGEQ